RVCPIVREPDGLAMSSRNRYLSADERKQSLAISQALRTAKDLVSKGERNASVIRTAMEAILHAADIRQIDYIGLADTETLTDVVQIQSGTVALIAARVGTTRLIDNEILL